MLVLLAAALSYSPESRLGLSRLSSPGSTARAVVEQIGRLRGGSTSQKCDVVLVGCGVPKRGMGWYHGKQMLEGDVPSAQMTAVVEPWFLGAGADSPPGEVFAAWAADMEEKYGTKFVKDVSELEIQVSDLHLLLLTIAHALQRLIPQKASQPTFLCRPQLTGVALPLNAGTMLGINIRTHCGQPSTLEGGQCCALYPHRTVCMPHTLL